MDLDDEPIITEVTLVVGGGSMEALQSCKMENETAEPGGLEPVEPVTHLQIKYIVDPLYQLDGQLY